jgi:hypothetical protein
VRQDSISQMQECSWGHPHTPPPHPPSATHDLPDLFVTVRAQNDSASVGCIPTRESKSDFFAPSLTAKANPWRKRKEIHAHITSERM